jgi:hypothetical protein
MQRLGRLLTSRWCAAVLAALLLVAAAGCGRQERPAPSLVGERLDDAIDVLDRAGLDYDTNGGGLLGPIVKSRWLVCRQDPAPGAQTKLIVLFVDRDCAPIELPALAGTRLDEARRRLTSRLATANVEVLDLRSSPVDLARPERVACLQGRSFRLRLRRRGERLAVRGADLPPTDGPGSRRSPARGCPRRRARVHG